MIQTINTLNIDLETFSSIEIKKSGLYKYVQSPDFEILLFAYSINGQPTTIVDLAQGEQIPFDIIFALGNPSVIKKAYNAAFEWYCLSKHLGWDPFSWLHHWRDTMFHGLYCGLTIGLDITAKVLGLPPDKQKMSVGKTLIKLFCTPTKPTAKNGNRTRTLPHHEPEKWQLFKDYCIGDVEAEKEVDKRLENFPVPESEQRLWELDQRINVFGVNVDMSLIEGALYIDDLTTAALTLEAHNITKLSNPNSAQQLTKWLAEKGIVTDNMQKETVSNLIKETEGEVKRVLEIRQELSKTSIKKYRAMVEAVCSDGRIRGLLQFYGANRTGRFAGRLVQVQNLPKNHMETLDLARQLTQEKKHRALEFIYGNIPDTLSQLIRTAFIPSKGRILRVADFSAIEARVLSWLAGEQWRLDVFNSHGKIYEASASQMFGVPIELIVKGNPEYELRGLGKVAELALGYQGGPGAMAQMDKKGEIEPDKYPDIVRRWRTANKRIQDLWYGLENAALSVMRTGQPAGIRGLIVARESDIQNGLDFLTITLPSGRKLFYVKPFLAENDFGKEAVHYWGLNQETKKWERMSTYGGRLVENVTQAIARDCLTVSLQRLEAAGYATVFHVHDEAVLDVPQGRGSVEEVEAIMGAPISWAPGLPLKAAGFEAYYYQKD